MMSDEAITQAAHVEVLYRAARAVIAQHDLQEVFQTIVNGAAEVLQAQRVLLFAVDMQAERITHIAKGGADPEPIVPISFAELNEGLAGWAIRERQIAFSAKAMVIGDPRESPEVRRRRTEMGIGSLLVAPIVREAQVLGILSAVNTMSQPDFTAEDIALMEALAEQAAAAIHNARLLAQAQHKAELLAVGADVTRLISSILSLEEMLPRVVATIQERFGLYYAGLFLLDRSGKWAELRAGSGEAGVQMLAAHHRLEVGGNSMIGACVAEGQARIALDVGKEARRFDNPFLPATHSEMALPLIGRGQHIFGAMTIQSDRVAAFATEDIAALQMLADQIAMAIENATLFEQREKRIKELSVLADLQQAFAQAPDLDAILRSAYEQVSRLFDTQDFFIATYEEGHEEWTLAFQMAHGQLQAPSKHPLEQGLTGYIIRNRVPLHLANLEENRAFMVSQGLNLVGDEALSWLGVPLITANKVVGVMAVESYEFENLFTPSDQELLQTIALQVANALEANRLFREVQQRAVQLQTAAEVARATSSLLQPQELLERAVELIRERFDYYYVGAFLTDAEGRWAVLRAGTGEAGRRMLEAGHRLEVGGTSMIGACVAEGRPHIALDVGAEAVRFDNPLLPDTHSEMAIPLRRGAQVIGALTVQSSREAAFSEEDVTLMMIIADQLAVALENARLFEASQRNAEEVNLLFRATAELSASQDYAAILEVLRRYTSLEDADAFVSLERFDRPWRPDAPPAAFSPLARWTHEVPSEAFDAHYLLALADASQRVRPEAPLWIPNLAADVQLSASTRRFFRERFKAGALALVPLVVGGEWLGLLVAAYRKPREFSTSETRILLNLAGQAAVSLENRVRLEAISRKEVEQSTLLNNIPDSVYFKDTELRFTRVNAAQAMALGVEDPEVAVGKTDLDFFVGPSAQAAWEDDLRVVRDGVAVVQRLEHMYNREGQSRWFLATKIPMRDASGKIMGLVGISYNVTRLKNMEDEAQRRAVQLREAALISRTLSAILEVSELLPQAVTLISERLGYPGVALFLQEEAGAEDDPQSHHGLLLRAAAGERAAEHLQAGLRLPLEGGSPAARSLALRGAQLSEEVSLPLLTAPEGNGHVTEIALPLLRGEKALGALCIHTLAAEGFSADDVAMLQTLADQLANALEIARLLAEADRNVRQLEAAIGTYTVDSWREYLTRTRRLRAYRYDGVDLEMMTERTPEAQQAWREGHAVVYRQPSSDGTETEGEVTTLALPIRVREQVIGVLHIRSRGEQLAADTLPLLEEIGSRLGQALEVARLLEDTRARAAREQLAGAISGRVRAEMEVESLLERALRELSQALGVRRAAVELEVKE